MKRRWWWRWTLTDSRGTTWWGTCPMWAAQSVPEGMTLTRERVLTFGRLQPCTMHGCGQRHPVPASPLDR